MSCTDIKILVVGIDTCRFGTISKGKHVKMAVAVTF